CYQFSSGYSF
nr:immunoglobulin light chain junction region [Macaca mulatta]